MRITLAIGIFLVIMGIAGMCLSIALGSTSLVFVFFIPVILFEGILPVLSMISLMVGSVVLLIQLMSRGNAPTRGEREQTWGGIVMIGPFPILFGDIRGPIPFYIRIITIAVFTIVIVMFIVAILAIWL